MPSQLRVFTLFTSLLSAVLYFIRRDEFNYPEVSLRGALKFQSRL